jgi:DNA-binding NtrC family response regulator
VARHTKYVLRHNDGNKGKTARILVGIGANALWRRFKKTALD